MKHLLAVGSAGLLIVPTLGARHPVIQGSHKIAFVSGRQGNQPTLRVTATSG